MANSNSKKPLKALLLAAGLGTRLLPLTRNTPKCLVRVKDKPILKIWLEILEELGCDSVLINTHYLADQVDEFLLNYSSKKMKIDSVYESVLNGTAGTLLKNRDYFKDSNVLLIHADNYTNDDLKDFLNAHFNRPLNCDLTMLTFTTDNPASCGIVEKNDKNIVINFYEKVSYSVGNVANGAIYLFDYSFITKLISKKIFIKDFSNDVLPLFLGSIFSWHTNSVYIDIGTPDSLRKAQMVI